MTRLLLLALALGAASPAMAQQAQVLGDAPRIADGQGEIIVHVYIPGLDPADRVRAKPADGELLDLRVAGPELLELRLRPAERYQEDTLRVNLKIKGAVTLNEDVRVPLTSPPRASLEVQPEVDAWRVGERGEVLVTVRSTGHHPTPPEARDLSLRASEGKLGPVTRAPDGSFTARWTPPPKAEAPSVVVFTATDPTAPSEVVGLGQLALLVERAVPVSAPPGSQNVVIIGEQQVGPQTAPASGQLQVKALVDPRTPTLTLQSVDELGQRSVSELPIAFEAPSPVLIAPLPARVPAGARLTVHAAALDARGRPWSGAAPELVGQGQGRVEGGGLFSWEVTAPASPGSWTLTVRTAEGQDELSLAVVAGSPALSLSADPATLAPATRDLTVTARAKGPGGEALTGLKPRFTARGATLNGSVVDNGDGTYTQRLRVESGAERVVVGASLPPAPTGLPPARVVLWPSQAALPADGSSRVDLSVVVLDALGMPVPDQALTLSAPLGDGTVPPQGRSDREGLATLSYRAGTSPGPALVRVQAGGVAGEVLLWQHAPQGVAPSPSPGGDAPTRDATARWQATRPTLTVGRVGVDLPPPAALAVDTVPGYTTPGAAILVQVQVLDASGAPVAGVAPQVNASLGTVGPVSELGGGRYSVAVQLPPGVDGPLDVQVSAGDARGAARLETLAAMGGPQALATAEEDDAPAGRSPRPDRPQGPAPGSQRLRLRVLAADTWLSHGAESAGDAGAPLSARVDKPLPLGVPGLGLDLVAHPTGGPFGLDLRARGGVYRYALGAGAAEQVVADPLYTAALGARFSPGPGRAVRPTVGLGVGVTDSLAFAFADDTRATAVPVDALVPGARLSAGLTVDTARADLSLELSELFGPAPSVTHAGLLLDLDVLPGAASLSLGVEADLQHLDLTLDDGTEVSVRALRGGALAGLALAF